MDTFDQQPPTDAESGTGEPDPEAPEGEAAPPPVDYDGEEKNLAKLMSADDLKAIAARVISSDESARQSCAGWRKKTSDYLRMYNGDVPDAGTGGQENIVPMHLPFTKRSIRTFASKLFAQFFPPTGDIVNAKVRSPGLRDQADKVATHMNFQLINEIEEYVPSHDRGILQTLIEGSIFETFWYDQFLKRPAQEISLAEDFSIPYTAKTDRPDMADVPFKTWTKRYQMHQLEALEAEGYYIGITQAFEHPDGTETPAIAADPYGKEGAQKAQPVTPHRDTPVKDQADESSGVEQRSDDMDGMRTFKEQDRMLRLPGAPTQRMCTVCVDEATNTVVRLSLCEREDSADRKRFNNETAVHQQAVQTATLMHQQATDMHGQAMQAHMAGPDPMTGMQAPHPGAPPAPPQMPPAPAPVKKVPWHRHVKYDCSPNPEGSLGIGLAADVYGHNSLADKTATRATSLLTLNCLPTFIHSRQSKFGRGEMKLKLGASNESPLSPTQVQDGAGLFRVQFPPPDPNWYKIIEMTDNACQEVTAFNIASGGASMSGETATESEMRHSNATDNISAIGQRNMRARAASLRNLAYINSETLPDEGVSIYKDGAVVTVTREDYQAVLSEIEFTLTCDPSFESKPLKEKRAQKLAATISQIANTPVLAIGAPMVDPQTSIQLLRAAAVNLMKAQEAPAEMIAAVANAPLPPPPPPIGVAPPGGPPQEKGPPPNGQQHNAGPGPAGGIHPGGGPPPPSPPPGPQGPPGG